jgi:hypothetical protein
MPPKINERNWSFGTLGDEVRKIAGSRKKSPAEEDEDARKRKEEEEERRRRMTASERGLK